MTVKLIRSPFTIASPTNLFAEHADCLSTLALRFYLNAHV